MKVIIDDEVYIKEPPSPSEYEKTIAFMQDRYQRLRDTNNVLELQNDILRESILRLSGIKPPTEEHFQ